MPELMRLRRQISIAPKAFGGRSTMFNVVLIEPEIPPNTGNVGRLCLATESTLHLHYHWWTWVVRNNPYSYQSVYGRGPWYWFVIRLPVLMNCLFPRKSAKAIVLSSMTFRKPFGPPRC